jgi:tetratricopeptide (TPR) repeat protein
MKENFVFYNIIFILIYSIFCMGFTHKINSDDKLNEAIELLKKQEYKESIRICDDIIQNQPKFLQVYLAKGYALDCMKKHQEAIETYDLALKQKPNFAEAYNEKATVLGELGKHQEAIKNYDLAIKYKPDFVHAYYNKGVELNAINKYQEAIAAYDLAIKYKPDFEAALYGKIKALERLGKRQEAEKLYFQMWDKETLAEYKKALEGGEHFDLNGQHVVVIRPKDNDKKSTKDTPSSPKPQPSSK